MRRYPLAPMSGLIYWLTLAVLPLPLVLFYAGSRTGVTPIAWGPALFVATIYLGIWLYMRPSWFELSERSLDIVWPVRRFSLPLAEIERVEIVTAEEFRSRYGYGMRIGAGGLWGGFGLLKTKSVTFRFYISRMDGYVIVHRHAGRPLLITPAQAESFVGTLETLRAGFRRA